MSARTMVLLAGAWLSACSQGFSSPSRVDGPRVLAVVVDPPAGPVGTHVRLRAALGGMSANAAVHWRWCRPGAGTEISGETLVPSDDCLEGGASSVEVASEFDIPDNYLLDVQRALADADAGAGDAALPTRVPLILVASADDGNGPARAVKRFGVTLDGSTSENPAAPVLRIASGGREWVLRAGDDGRCATDDGDPVAVDTGASVTVSLEASAARCELFATAGDVRDGGGCAGWVWAAPGESTAVTQWFTLADADGGTAYCEYGVTVR